MMRDIIINTAKTLYDPDESDMTEKIDSGAFAGLNMWEAMLISKTTDVKAFLRYVIDYPHKYMGRKFRIDESYATWVINFTPTNEDDGNLLSKLYKEIVTDADWENWESAYGRYLKVTAFDFSQVQTNIYAVANQGNLDSAIKLVDQWSALTTKYNYRQEYRDFELIRAWVFQTKKQYSESEKVYIDLLKEDSTNYNIHWQLGLMYLTSENLMKALPEFAFVKDNMSEYAFGHGMYGWTLIKLGRFKASEEHTEKAHMLIVMMPLTP